jgi:hypothetical protein
VEDLRTPVDCDPFIDCVRDQPPVVEQDVAFFTVQLSIALVPLATLLGDADSVIVGAAEFTDTVTDWAAVPPGPVQLSV